MTRKLNNPSGAKAEDPNFGYDVPRHIVEKASGKTFAAYARELLGARRPEDFTTRTASREGRPAACVELPARRRRSQRIRAPAMRQFLHGYWIETADPAAARRHMFSSAACPARRLSWHSGQTIST